MDTESDSIVARESNTKYKLEMEVKATLDQCAMLHCTNYKTVVKLSDEC